MYISSFDRKRKKIGINCHLTIQIYNISLANENYDILFKKLYTIWDIIIIFHN